MSFRFSPINWRHPSFYPASHPFPPPPPPPPPPPISHRLLSAASSRTSVFDEDTSRVPHVYRLTDVLHRRQLPPPRPLPCRPLASPGDQRHHCPRTSAHECLRGDLSPIAGSDVWWRHRDWSPRDVQCLSSLYHSADVDGVFGTITRHAVCSETPFEVICRL